MTEPYGHIFLQWGNHADLDSATWAEDEVDDDDVAYIRKDLHDEAVADLLEACGAAQTAFANILELGLMYPGYEDGTREMRDIMAAAIAKAKGEK